MNKKCFIFLVCMCLIWTGCGNTNSNQEIQAQSDDDKINTENTSTENVEQEITEQDLQEVVYDRYYALWSEDEMITAINERSQNKEQCSFYEEVLDYMENVREVRDISIVVEPLYYTDLKYYKSQDFSKEPSLIIHLAKNEIYARHGYIFKDQDLYYYFMTQIWYEPNCLPEEFDTSIFNKYEKENLKILSELDNYN